MLAGDAETGPTRQGIASTSPVGTPHPAIGPCREYQGGKVGNGYGRTPFAKKGLHRWVVEQAEGKPLLPGEVVMHLCDNPPCFLYAHLKRATQSENLLDAVVKGRHKFRPSIGEDNGQAILSADQVVKIRQMYMVGPGKKSNADLLAEKFGVSKRTIQAVVWREKWKHL